MIRRRWMTRSLAIVGFVLLIVPTGYAHAGEVPKSVGQLQNCTGDGIRSAWPVWKNPRASFS